MTLILAATISAVINMAIQPFAMQGTTPNVMLPSEALYNAGKAKAVENENTMFNQQQAEQSKLDQLYRESGGDMNKMMQSPDLGFNAGTKLQAISSENVKAANAAKVGQLDFMLKGAEYSAQLAGSVKDQAGWDQIRQHLGETLGEQALAQLPEQYSPEAAQKVYENALSFKDKMQLRQADLAERGMAQRAMQQDRMYGATMARIDASERNAERRSASGGGDGGSSADWVIDKESGKRYNRATGEVLPLLENGKEYAPPVVKPKGSTMTGTEIKLENDIRSATSKAVDVGDKIAGHLKALELGTLKPGAESTIRTAVASKTGYFGNDNTDAMASLMQDAAEARDAEIGRAHV